MINPAQKTPPAASDLAVLLDRDTTRRIDLEGELTATQAAGFSILRLNDAELTEVLTYLSQTPRDGGGKRNFGRVRITVERLEE